MKPNKFDTTANVLYVEHEVTPETVLIKEDSFSKPADGYTPEQWAGMDYRKRRYITLRDRARKAPREEPGDMPMAKGPTTRAAVVNNEPADDDAETAEEPLDTTSTVAEPTVSVGGYVDSIINFVNNNENATKEDLFNYLAAHFGDVLNTDSSINSVISKAINNNHIQIDASGHLSTSDSSELSNTDPSDGELKDLSNIGTDTQKKQERDALFKRFMAWRQNKKQAPIADTEVEGDDDDEDEDDPAVTADKVLGRRNFKHVKDTDQDWESDTGDQSD